MSGEQRDLGAPTIVGLGASAGGLEALSELFRHIPAETGLAYVIVQHLSPTHGSILAELLARQSAIPVHEAVDGERVEVDRAYVIAPDTEMTLVDGHLKLAPRDPNVHPPLPIDAFFRSLAEVQESRTIGVILSGTGSDGALGVRAIKGAGGITFAQDPASAGSDGMPRAAIATNCVDVVATPAEIAAQIVRLGRHPYLRSGPSGDARGVPAAGVPDAPDGHAEAHRATASEPRAHIQTAVAARDHAPAEDPGTGSVEARTRADAVSAIWSLLRHRCGVDFGLYKPGMVERRIQRRMALRKIDTLTGYADVLHHDVQELDTLYGDLLIGVTRFFRDPEVFGALSHTVLPALLTQRVVDSTGDRAVGPAQTAPLRVWVAGCSTGEEAYSMAMCLLEAVDDHAPGTPIQIFATDVSETAIAVARAGVYPNGIEADVTPERLRRFFTSEENGYRVTKAVRDCCTFARQNITADPPFSQLDLVSCRNVLIYLQPRAHARLLAVFHYALKPHGVLVLGMSESISTAPTLFTPIDKKHHIYTRLAGPARPLYVNIAPAQPALASPGTHVDLLPPSHQPMTTSASPMTGLPRPPLVPDLQRAADQVVLGRYAPAGVVVDDQLHILQFRGQTGLYIEPAAGTASFHLLTMVTPELTTALRTALETARAEARPVRAEGVSFHDGTRFAQVTLDVTPFRVAGSDAQFFVISFEDTGADASRAPTRDTHHQPAHEHLGRGAGATSNTPVSTSTQRRRQDDAKERGELRQELEATRRHLQAITEEYASVVEALQGTNEEIQSSNEELQSTNEELETSKE